MEEDALSALANPTNQAILSLLAIEPGYPRRVADLLSRSESDVSRRLRRMEDAGIVASGWERIREKNVKAYRLVPDEIAVRIDAQGLTIEARNDEDDATTSTVVDRLKVHVPEPEGFVGRAREMETLAGEDPVVLVEGIAGIGKTSLAAEHAHEAMATRDVFFHSFSGTESLTWLAHRYAVFHARHHDPTLLEDIQDAALPDQRGLLLDAMDHAGTLTVLDATEQIRDEDLQTFLSDAIAHVQDGNLVVTARTLPGFNPALDTVTRLRLTGLSAGEVRTFLEQQGLPVDDDAAEHVQRRLGGHPLAVNLLAQTAKETQRPLNDIVDHVPEQGIEEYLLHEVNQHLTEQEKNLLAHASIYPGPFTLPDIEALYPGNPGGALVQLRRRRLLNEEGERYRMHELLRPFFTERLDDPEGLHEQAAEHALAKGTLEARLSALYHLLEAGKPKRVLSLLERDLDLEEYDLIEEGYHNLYLDVLERFDPETINDDQQAALVHDERGDIHHHRGDHDQALQAYQEAKERFTLADAQDRLADIAWKRALSLKALSRDEEAIEQAREGLDDHAPDAKTKERLAALLHDLEDA